MAKQKKLSDNFKKKFSGAFTKEGATPEEMNGISQDPQLIRGTLAVYRKMAEIKPLSSWYEKDNTIYFTLISNGMMGEEWITHFDRRGIKIGDYAKQLLRSKEFKASPKGTVYQIAVIKGEFFSDETRVTSKICLEGDRRKYTKPNAEVACLIRDLFTNEEIKKMGLLWIVAMHEPINDSHGGPGLLYANAYDSGPWLDAYYGEPDRRWRRENGFALVVSQVSA